MQANGPPQKDVEVDNSFNSLFILGNQNNDNKKRKTVISGHRGGFLPDNTLHAFKKAKHHNLPMVELDVSIPIYRKVFIQLTDSKYSFGLPQTMCWQ